MHMTTTIRRRTLSGIAALALLGAVSAPAAAQSPAPGAEFELPSTAPSEGSAASRPGAPVKKARRGCKATAKKAKRSCMRRRSATSGFQWGYGSRAYPQTGFQGCSSWTRSSNGVMTTACYWVNSDSSAPGGAHLIGWQNTYSHQVQNFYYNASTRQVHYWYWSTWRSVG